MSVRTRFAPSPTGALHVGNVRIAVFNWLYARHHAGAFVLRMEDTDVGRNQPEAEAGIMEDLRWLGLEWDEGPGVGGPYGPYRQSQRLGIYREGADALVEKGAAYPCYCTEEDLAAEVEELSGSRVLRYSGRCRELTAARRAALEKEGRDPVIRFAVPEIGSVEVNDYIRGAISFSDSEISDFILLRRDGRPTYNFAVVVDDAHMEITHVIRGAGHLSNTPKQALLFDALGRKRPVFVHLPTVLAEEGGKLSKRSGAAAVAELRRDGFPPEAVVNYLSLLGWSHPQEEEVLSLEELVATVDLKRVGSADTSFDSEKLRWISAQHVAAMDLEELTRAVEPFLDRERFPLERGRLRRAVDALRTRLHSFGEINEHLPLLFPDPGADLEDARQALREDPDARRVLSAVKRRLAGLEGWEAPEPAEAVRDAGREVGVRGADLFHPVRTALIGQPSGPDLGKILAAVGREETLARIELTLSSAGG